MWVNSLIGWQQSTTNAHSLRNKSGETPRVKLGKPACALFARASAIGATREADAEFLQRRAARDRLGDALGEFIESVVHISALLSEGANREAGEIVRIAGRQTSPSGF